MKDFDLGLFKVSSRDLSVVSESSIEAIEKWNNLNWFQKLFKKEPEKDVVDFYIIDHDEGKVYSYNHKRTEGVV